MASPRLPMYLLCDAINFESGQVTHQSVSPSGPPSAPSVASKTKTCRICGRTYERADHLQRHLKSHENNRSYKCTRCTKSFNRADLLNRHQASHDRSDRPHRPNVVIDRGDRVAAACNACVRAKTKCDDTTPCSRCVKRGISCETSSQRSQTERQSSVNERQEVTFDLMEDQDSMGLDNHQDHSGVENILFPLPTPTNIDNVQYDNVNMTDANIIDYQFSDHLSFDSGVGFVPREPYFSQDLDFGVWDFDLESIDLAFGGNSLPNIGQSPNDVRRPSSSIPADVSKRLQAFLRSPWLWTPTQEDQSLNDHSSLDVDENSIPAVLTAASPVSDVEDFRSCLITEKARDQMAALLFSVPKTPNSPACLPSLSLLNKLVQVYFTQERMRVDHLIHTATFNASQALPALLLAVVAAGSQLIAIPAIWKMGLAMQEIVRLTVAEYWEQNNTKTRNLQALQAFMIMLDIGLWSGFKRKMEIAESFGQPIAVMLRRAGTFEALENPAAFDPELSDSPSLLEAKWKKWAERESWKRLVLHLFMHDNHASIGLQKPPLMSFSELKLPLPASRNLWLAKSSPEWRDLFLSASSTPPPPTTLSTATTSPEALLQHSSQIDVHLTTTTILHGFWSQIWYLADSKKFFPANKTIQRLCLHTAYTELYADLLSFSALLPTLTRNSPSLTMLSELLLMILHVNLEDLQRFAGKFGEEEARCAAEKFGEWAKGKEAHLAVWHAGQVFRAARQLLLAHNRDFNAIALYYASLTLWVYGLSAEAASSGTRQVVLNEAEDQDSKSFLSGGLGAPVLRVGTEGEVVELGNADAVLGVARGLYKSNFPVGEGESLPPLVENLSDLLRDLGTMPGSRISRASTEGPG